MLRLLTRVPSSKFSEDLVTGVPAFDDYLRRLDAELLGRASLRRVTLEEVRDHLLEQQAMLTEQGLNSDTAAQQALDGFGSAQELGAEQRREKTRDFLKNFMLFGLFFAGLMTIFALVSEIPGSLPWYSLVIAFAFNFIFYGLFMSLFMTFSNFQTSATKPEPKENWGSANTLEVYTTPKAKLLAIIMCILSGIMFIVCIMGIFGVFPLYGLYGNLLMGYLALFLMSGMATSWTHLSLNGSELHIKSLFQNKHFGIAKVKEFKRQALWRIYLPPAFGRTHKLVLLTDQNETQTLYFSLNAEMYESDRLIAYLEAMKKRWAPSAG